MCPRFLVRRTGATPQRPSSASSGHRLKQYGCRVSVPTFFGETLVIEMGPEAIQPPVEQRWGMNRL